MTPATSYIVTSRAKSHQVKSSWIGISDDPRGIFAVIWGRNSRVEHLLVDDFPIIIHNDI
jgi:hypothetical protein